MPPSAGLSNLDTYLLHMQLPKLVEAHTLQSEISRVSSGAAAPPAPDCSCLEAVAQLPSKAAVLLPLLLQWAAAIGHQYGVSVQSVQHAFADGRLLCLLVGSAMIRCLANFCRQYGCHATSLGSMQMAPCNANLQSFERSSCGQLHEAGQSCWQHHVVSANSNFISIAAHESCTRPGFGCICFTLIACMLSKHINVRLHEILSGICF